MINKKKVLAIIPARGGSKGLPHKNIHDLYGKPLISWTIESALSSKYIDRLILSSDDDEIIKVAHEYGCDIPFKRPSYLATDCASTLDVIIHALKCVSGYDYIVLLQPTSPLKISKDIDDTIEKANPVAVSITESTKSPYWMFKLDNELIQPIIKLDSKRRQEQEKTYVLNGAIYVSEIEYYLREKSFLTKDTAYTIMPKERSVDIDYKEDLIVAEYYMNKKYIE